MFTNHPLHSPLPSQFLPQHRHSSSLTIRTRRNLRIQRPTSRFPRKSVNLISNAHPFVSFIFPGTPNYSEYLVGEEDNDEKSFLEASSSSNLVNCTVNHTESEQNVIKYVIKSVVYSLFCIAIGFSPIWTLKVPAIAQVAVLDRKENVEEKESNSRGHEYSECTRKLLETVSGLLRSAEEVKNGNGDQKKLEEALKAVKLKKEELQERILNELYVELRELKSEKQGLENRLEEIVDEVVKAKGECEKLVGGGEEGNERRETLEGILRGLEEEYEGKWRRIGEIEDGILRKETVALSFGVRELCFIERECDELVKRFNHVIRQKGNDRYV